MGLFFFWKRKIFYFISTREVASSAFLFSVSVVRANSLNAPF